MEKRKEKYLKVLNKYFGYSSFRSNQFEIIDAIVHEKRDVLTILPTGSGKSLCFQLPALITKKTAIVVSPLIALMEDQKISMEQADVPCCCLNSSEKNKGQLIKEILNNKYRLVYITPEYMEHAEDLFLSLYHDGNLACISIDESHCISSWGVSFRPSYRALSILKKWIPDEVPIVALTATATAVVKQDIIDNLKLKNPVIITASFDRPNLYLEIKPKSKSMKDDLIPLLAKKTDSVIIYCQTRKETEEISNLLKQRGINSGFYHAGMSDKDRVKIHHEFLRDDIRVVIATIAFGLGINKYNVRKVIHYGSPKDIESYYQEIGRAGRDGLASQCYAFYGSRDFMIHRHFISKIDNTEFQKFRMNNLVKMEKFLQLEPGKCRRSYVLSYFGEIMKSKDHEDDIENPDHYCGNCDNCFRRGDANETEKKDLGREALMIMTLIKDSNSFYGFSTLTQALRGSNNKKMSYYLKRSIYFGEGTHKNEKWWKIFGRLLVQEGYLRDKAITNTFGSTVGFTDKGYEWMKLEHPKMLIKPSIDLLSADPGLEYHQDPEEILYQKLIQLRASLSKQYKMPPYVIVPDVSIIEMSRRRPMTIEHLLEINGVDERRCSKFGQLFINEIQDFVLDSDLNNEQNFYDNDDENLETKSKPKPKPKPREKKIKDIDLPIDLNLNMKNCPKGYSQTKMTTYVLFQEKKMNIKEISNIRNIKKQSIENHLADAIEFNLTLNFKRMGVKRKIYKEIKKAIKSPTVNKDFSQLRPIKDLLPDCSYFQIKIVISLMKNKINPFKKLDKDKNKDKAIIEDKTIVEDKTIIEDKTIVEDKAINKNKKDKAIIDDKAIDKNKSRR